MSTFWLEYNTRATSRYLLPPILETMRIYLSYSLYGDGVKLGVDVPLA